MWNSLRLRARGRIRRRKGEIASSAYRPGTARPLRRIFDCKVRDRGGGTSPPRVRRYCDASSPRCPDTLPLSRHCPIAENKNAAVLEKAADHASDANTAADAAHARTQRARAAHDQFDLHAGLRGSIERLNDSFVEKRIHFGDDKSRPARAARARFRARSS